MTFKFLALRINRKKGVDKSFFAGASIKVASTVFKSVKQLNAFLRNIETAERTLILESVASVQTGVRIGEIFQTAQKVVPLTEELGIGARKVVQLKNGAMLESPAGKIVDGFGNNPIMRQSFELFEKAEEILKPYAGKYLPESQIRELIHKAGLQPISRPMGIPENFRIKLSDKPGGIKYVHPEHTHESIRIMPGKPHSPNPLQQKPYVVHMRDGKALDRYGNLVDLSSSEAHIPLEEYIYRKK